MRDNSNEPPERPEPIDIESTFNQFVNFYGGKQVADMFQNKITTPNADYYFPDQNIIAELKCFEKDMASVEGFERMEKLFESWLSRGLIKGEEFIAIAFGRIPYPQQCIMELWTSIRKSVDYVLDKAVKQVRETRKLLGKPDASGLLLLCNDGNYGLTHRELLGVIGNLMASKYSSMVDGFVYFTYNQTVRIPGSDIDHQLWTAAYSENTPDKIVNFVDDLGSKYFKFMEVHTGVPIAESRVMDVKDGVSLIKDMVYVPKEKVFKKAGKQRSKKGK
ncbi:hypothetical protein [Chryseolinea soli]|uniref:Uncharacterized protein n=1 Tax=Chryseolinea soli TaxID=2321403 RepID=A0A385SMP4_9BACT|nr:hypothetical protein [Chryseolinea soli]AYB33043.1 hypothetical protein D4L85_21770 [Chryseolinea soli]